MKNQLGSIKRSFIAVAISAMAMPAFANVGGFVDAQVVMNGTSPNNPTFTLNDGAVYLSKELGKGKVLVDIPFAGVAGGTGLALGGVKSQAYVTYGYDFGLNWTLGKFDSFFGYEANDSVGVLFSNQGLVWGKTNRTFTGLMIDWANGPISFKAVAANNGGLGSRDGGTTTVNNFDYAGMLKFTHDMFWVSAAYLHHKNPTTTNSEMMADFILGTKVADLTADVEFLLSKGSYAGAESGFGVMANLMYAINKEWTFGLRPELLSKSAGYNGAAAGNHSSFQITAGPQAKLTDDLTVKIDYTYNSTHVVNGDTATNTHTGVVAGVYKF